MRRLALPVPLAARHKPFAGGKTIVDSVYVIQHRDGRFLTKQHDWVGCDEPQAVFRTPHRDLALNELFELTARHPELRARVAEVQTNVRGLPELQTVALPAAAGAQPPASAAAATPDEAGSDAAAAQYPDTAVEPEPLC